MSTLHHDASELTEQLKQALDRLWTQYLPEMEQRIATIEQACTDYCDKTRDSGREAAHKLSGVLGTFGLDKGTAFAREAETLLSQWNAESTARISTIVTHLRQLIATRS